MPTGRRWTYAELDARGRPAGPRRCWPAASPRATGSASGRRTAPSGCSCSTPRRRSARSWSTSTRPTAPTSWRTCSTSRACGCWSARRSLQDQRLPGHGRRRCAACRSRTSSISATPSWEALLAEVGASQATLRRADRPELGLRRPDQHPVHVGHHRLPEGRDALAPQHPQQRLLRRRALRLHRGGPGVPAGAASTTASAW